MMKYFFLTGHVHYARYLTQYLLEMASLPSDTKVDIVCGHDPGYWNADSADQFGEQTAIKLGKGGLKGMTLSAELVSEWIDAFPITAHVSDLLDGICFDEKPEKSEQNYHKEELKHRRVLDANDRDLKSSNIKKYSHPLEDVRPIYTILSLAPAEVNVANSIAIGEKMEREYIASLPDGLSVVQSRQCLSSKNR